MYLDFTYMLYGLSFALDALENEFNGAMHGHTNRVALMSERMGKQAGLSDTELIDLTGVAVLHDNSIFEFLDGVAGVENFKNAGAMEGHCARGEERIGILPFKSDVKNAILYHHETAAGNGPFHKKPDEVNLYAQIIHLADNVDTHFKMREISEGSISRVSDYVHREEGRQFSSEVVTLFDKSFTADAVKEIEQKGIDKCLKDDVPSEIRDYSSEEIHGIAKFFVDMVDFKSSFTKEHSRGVASKAERMAGYYGWDEEKTDRYYFAGALHDIGKMIITNDILEKPDRLTGGEFEQMQNHASATYKVLHQIEGLEDITEWASNHHEKLDGSGYPRALKAEEQSFEDRLMACIDIYQALTEKRPYKDGLSHNKTMGIMRDMVSGGKIDGAIVEDLDTVYGGDAAADTAEKQMAEQALKRWRCPVCGYIYEGEVRPERCPVCDMPGENYIPI